MIRMKACQDIAATPCQQLLLCPSRIHGLLLTEIDIMAMQEHELLAPEATSTSRKGLKGHVKSAYMSTKKFFKGHGNRKYQFKEHGHPMIVEVRLGQPKPSSQNPDKGHDASHIDP